jgi:ABC-type branched-subunit amino acid transport system permease subunit
MMTYIGSALLASLAGVVIAARSASANADYGASYVLLAIVIVVLGGVKYSGGYGTVTGVVLSAFVLQFVSSGFNQIGLNNFIYNIAQGCILIGVMALSSPSLRWKWTDQFAFLIRRRGREPKRLVPHGAGDHSVEVEPATSGSEEAGTPPKGEN